MNLREYSAVAAAITRISAEKTIMHDNGTGGQEYLAFIWDTETQYNKEAQELVTAMTKATFAGDQQGFILAKNKLGLMKDAKKAVFQLRLVEPIVGLRGTKLFYGDGKVKHPEMKEVNTLYVTEDTLDLADVEFVATGEFAVDRQGQQAEILKITLKEGIIDVKEGKTDRFGKVVIEPRAYIYPVSARSMQIVGQMEFREKNRRANLYGLAE